MKVEKSTLQFLKDLAKNNDRDWFHANKKAYQAAKSNFEEVVQGLINGIASFDDYGAELTPKECVFRINRDVRFSKDKSPYKSNFAANMSKNGKKSMLPGYYFHIKPGGESFVAGGMYMPESKDLAKIRQEIDYNAKGLKDVISKTSFKKWYPVLEGQQLKTAPKGYPKDHPEIELLRYKGFIVIHKFKDEDVLKESFIKEAVAGLKEILPFKFVFENGYGLVKQPITTIFRLNDTMKNLILLLLLFTTSFIYAQDSVQISSTDTVAPLIIEEVAEPVGGLQAFQQHIKDYIIENYPKKAKKHEIQGKVIVQFIVEKDGSLSNFEILKGIEGGCNEICIEAIKAYGKWEPVMYKGRKIRQKMALPITFRLE